MRREPNRPRNDWDDDYWFPSLGQGSVNDLGDTSASPETAAILLVPDPEQRRGWREYYVRHAKPNAKPANPMGFRPKGDS